MDDRPGHWQGYRCSEENDFRRSGRIGYNISSLYCGGVGHHAGVCSINGVKMKTLILRNIVFFALSVFLLAPLVTYGQSDDTKKYFNNNTDIGSRANLPSPTTATTPTDIVVKVVRFLLSFLGLLMVALILYGGYKWMTDEGTGKGIDEAKKIITSAVMGLVLILSAYIISEWTITKIFGLVSS